MADLFSVASGAVGVVSLGFTVCDGLISYFSAFHGQDQYLDNLSHRARGLSDSLSLLSRVLPTWTTGTPDVEHQIGLLLMECNTSIRLLENKVDSFRRVHGPSLKRDRLKHIAKRTVFPFKKDALLELSGTIDSLQLNMDTILSIANLEASSSQFKIQNSMDAKIDTVITVSGGLRSSIQRTGRGIASLQADFSTVQRDLDTLKSTIDPGFQMVMQRVDNLTEQITRLRVSSVSTANTVDQVNLQIRDLQRQLISKPSLFDIVCQDAAKIQLAPRSDPVAMSSSPSPCACQRYKSRRKPDKETLVFEYSQTSEHNETCLFYIDGRKKRTLNFKLSWKSMLISRTIQIMARLSTGSGGIAMSSYVDWIPIVPRSSPAVSILRDLNSMALYYNPQPHLLVDTARDELLKLFARREAHPKEIDEDGQSLLHHAISIPIFGWRDVEDGFVEALCRLLCSLASLGAKAPLAVLLSEVSWSEDAEAKAKLGPLADQLLRMDALSRDPGPLPSHPWGSLIRYSEWHDAFDGGPLSRAIMRLDSFELTRLLHRKQASLLDVNDWGHSAVHLSAAWPLGLVTLLKFGGASLVNQKDEHGQSPLSYTMCQLVFSGTNPNRLHPWTCAPRSELAIAMKLLLAAGAAISESTDARGDMISLLDGLLRIGDTNTAHVLLEALAYRRRRLQTLAESFLPPPFWNTILGTKDRLLDEQAHKVVTALLHADAVVPTSCSIPQKQETVYHNFLGFSRENLALQKLWDAGFRDVDGQDYQGRTPLMGLNLVDHIYSNSTQSLGEWFLHHGADLLHDFPQCRDDCRGPAGHRRPRGLKAIHAFACCSTDHLGAFFSRSLSRSISQSELIATILTSEISDGCSCACSEQGCVPCLNLLGGFNPLLDRSHRGTIPWKSLKSRLSSLFTPLLVALIRLWTFEALELTHTCCRHGCKKDDLRCDKPCPFSTPSDDEVQEIQDEERESIALHESLVGEFTGILLSSSWDPKQFLSKTWQPRMRKIRDFKPQVPEDEMAEILKLGVILTIHDEDASDSAPGEDEVLNDGNASHRGAELSDSDAELSDGDVERSDDAAEFSDDAEGDQPASSEDDESIYTGSEEEQTVLEDQQHDREDDAQQWEAGTYNGQTIEGIDDVEIAEILKEAARINGLENYDVWFTMIGRPDPRLGHRGQ